MLIELYQSDHAYPRMSFLPNRATSVPLHKVVPLFLILLFLTRHTYEFSAHIVFYLRSLLIHPANVSVLLLKARLFTSLIIELASYPHSSQSSACSPCSTTLSGMPRRTTCAK